MKGEKNGRDKRGHPGPFNQERSGDGKRATDSVFAPVRGGSSYQSH